MKFYTDPDYFFQLWRQEMLKDTERMMHDKGKKVRRDDKLLFVVTLSMGMDSQLSSKKEN